MKTLNMLPMGLYVASVFFMLIGCGSYIISECLNEKLFVSRRTIIFFKKSSVKLFVSGFFCLVIFLVYIFSYLFVSIATDITFKVEWFNFNAWIMGGFYLMHMVIFFSSLYCYYQSYRDVYPPFSPEEEAKLFDEVKNIQKKKKCIDDEIKKL